MSTALKQLREKSLSQVAPHLSYFNDCKPAFAISECKKWVNKIFDDVEKLNSNIICLCGSTRFKKEFEEATRQESLKVKIVLSVCQFSHADNLQISEDEKIVFDELHKRKIDLANEILVINPSGYIGKSTKLEIEYAKSQSKTIRYLYEQKDNA